MRTTPARKQKMDAKRPSLFLVLFTDRMVSNCPMQLHFQYSMAVKPVEKYFRIVKYCLETEKVDGNALPF